MRPKFLAVLIAPLFLGAALFQGPVVEETQSVVCAPGITAGTYVSSNDTYYFGPGDSPARIAANHGSPRWQEFIALNSYLEGRIRENVRVRNRTFRYYADVKVCESLRGLQVLGLVPADLAARPSAATPGVTLGPVTVEQAVAGSDRWFFFLSGLLLLAFIIAAILVMERQRLNRENTGLQARLGATNNLLAQEREENQERLDEQQDLDFRARRLMMPPLPTGVEDAVLAGPPMRFGGVTDENRVAVLDEATRFAYHRLHPGSSFAGLTVERRNERRVLISSRPGETVEVEFGDGEPREVTLVREPGWILDAIIRRDGEVIQELKDICVIGPCANRICYTMQWLENCLVEDYEEAAIHTVPDWGAVGNGRRGHHVTLHSVDGQVVATVEGEPVLRADFFELQADGKGVRLEDDEVLVGRDAVLVPHRHMAVSNR